MFFTNGQKYWGALQWWNLFGVWQKRGVTVFCMYQIWEFYQSLNFYQDCKFLSRPTVTILNIRNICFFSGKKVYSREILVLLTFSITGTHTNTPMRKCIQKNYPSQKCNWYWMFSLKICLCFQSSVHWKSGAFQKIICQI